MLKFNSFRSDRYLRSRFVEGRYLLASELGDVELELIDSLRRATHSTIGNIAIDKAWQVERLSQTQLVIRPGEAWFQGLPFLMRSGTDELVSGASLTLGTVPPGVVVTDDATGLGKVLTFTAATTPSDTYRVVISAQEQVITNVEDPFLKNANISESTGQKVRLLFRINLVSESAQTETPRPYTNDSNSYNLANLVNKVTITPSSGDNGELLAVNPISGSAQIDGRDLELVIRNNSGLGAGVVIPNGTTDQQAFYNGKLIDSLGAEYHVNAIFNDVVSTQVVIRIDKEVGQPNPQLINGSPYSIVKRDVYVTDDSSGSPVGKLFWPVATAIWDTTDGFVHSSVVADLRDRVIDEDDFEKIINQKTNLSLLGGGILGFGIDGQTLTWSADFTIVNPSGPAQTIAASSAVLVDGGTLAYNMNLPFGGAIQVGNLSVTVATAGSTVTFSGSPDLSSVRIGNVLKVGTDVTQILTIDNVNKSVTVTPSISMTGSATIYRDSFGPGTVHLTENIYVLAAVASGVVVVGGTIRLGAGQSTAIYDERIQYPSGLSASTNITIPNNSRNSGLAQYYDPIKGDLQIFVNQLYKFEGVDWISIDPQTIQFTYDLTPDSEVHFRIDNLPNGNSGLSGGGGGGTLQDAYNAGQTINVVTGLPVTLNGSSGKLMQINGDLGVSGVVDPTAVQLSYQSSNPLAPDQAGIWVSPAGHLMSEKGDGSPSQNITQSIDDIMSGSTVAAITRTYTNLTGNPIPAYTPVYSPSAGHIAPANGSALTTARILGITTELINNTATGAVALAGTVESIGSYTHGKYLYLDQVDGGVTDVPPVLGPYSSGFNVIILGVIEGANLILHIQNVGTL